MCWKGTHGITRVPMWIPIRGGQRWCRVDVSDKRSKLSGSSSWWRAGIRVEWSRERQTNAVRGQWGFRSLPWQPTSNEVGEQLACSGCGSCFPICAWVWGEEGFFPMMWQPQISCLPWCLCWCWPCGTTASCRAVSVPYVLQWCHRRCISVLCL